MTTWASKTAAEKEEHRQKILDGQARRRERLGITVNSTPETYDFDLEIRRKKQSAAMKKSWARRKANEAVATNQKGEYLLDTTHAKVESPNGGAIQLAVTLEHRGLDPEGVWVGWLLVGNCPDRYRWVGLPEAECEEVAEFGDSLGLFGRVDGSPGSSLKIVWWINLQLV